ncbi:hypothetical protein [Leisingera sp. MMG026]|uniref:hypothetical protein n=1 Tax=Leisingera sp. MMG026 TaxID=2909982 RepID=UPI001F3FA807|nr:hypothetical protein [Leisingera sp. MMG026]MCF6432912.1 hypothetical protein [Leisingera sp. MMG026]
MTTPDELLATLPQTICGQVKTLLPELRECEPHEGKYSLEELKKDGLPSPAVKISILGAKQDKTFAASPATFMLKMAAYVVTRDGLGKPRDVRAANICQVLMTLIPGQRWGLNGLGDARDAEVHCLVSTKVKSKGVSLWALTWHQPISFHQPALQTLGVELYAGQAPYIGEDHLAQYEQIGGGDE